MKLIVPSSQSFLEVEDIIMPLDSKFKDQAILRKMSKILLIRFLSIFPLLNKISSYPNY